MSIRSALTPPIQLVSDQMYYHYTTAAPSSGLNQLQVQQPQQEINEFRKALQNPQSQMFFKLDSNRVASSGNT